MVKSFLRRLVINRYKIPHMESSLSRLSKLGFQPRLIFDVGAYIGEFTILCNRIFPDTKVACFEVLDHAVDELYKFSKNNTNIRIFKYLLGSENLDNVPFHESETASSVLEENVSQNFTVSHKEMKTLDYIVNLHYGGTPPDLLKLDVQGYELEVLKGSEKSLNNIKVILSEINILDIHKDVPLIADVIEWLNSRGWVVYDICGITRRPLDDALWQTDFIFVKKDSTFRSDKRWNI